MSVGYRAIARLDNLDNAITAAESQLVSWFGEKKNQGTLSRADWEGEGEHVLGPHASLTVVHDPDRRDGSARRLYRFRETNPAGVWTVSLSALVSPQSKGFHQSLVVDVDVDASSTGDAISRVSPPRLMRKILEAHVATDGVTPLTGEPRIIRATDAELVYSAIVDPDRTASVIVAPLPWSDDEALWRNAIRGLTTESVGIAAVFILDEAATDVFDSNLPPSHRIPKGVVRSFAPHVDLSAPEDGLRHPKLHPGFLSKHIHAGRVSRSLTKLHARSTRLRFIERELPADIRRGLDILHRVEATAQRARDVERRVLESSIPVSPIEVSPSAAVALEVAPASLQKLVERWLGPEMELSEETFVELDRLINRKSAEALQWEEDWNKIAEENDSLGSTLQQANLQIDDLGLDLAVAEEMLRNKDREVSFLRNRLMQQGNPQLAYVAPEEEIWQPPDDMMSLLDRITPGPDSHLAFSRVVFTGDTDAALEVEARDQASRYVHALWDYVHVLYDYAEGHAAGRVLVGVHLYLKSDEISGHKCPPDRHAPGESDTTLNRWGHERMRPVPTDVDPSGTVLMAAHFKPTWRDTFAPRMHYFDDTNGTGKIYIGYIGRHLTTKDS